MKKIVALLLCFLLVFLACMPVCAAAEEKEIYENGDYSLTGIGETPGYETEPVSVFARLLELLRSILRFLTGKKTVEKTKYVRYYSSGGELLWTLYLTASFDYNGKTAECVKASCSYDVADRDWKVISSSAARDGASAYGTFTVRQTKLGVPLKTMEKTVVITCTPDGKCT